MAVVRAWEALDFREFFARGSDRGDPIFESAEEFTVRYTDGRTGTYLGQFLVSNGEVFGGTATRYVESAGSLDLLDIAGFEVGLAEFEAAILAGTLEDLFATRILDGADEFLGGDFADYFTGFAGDDRLVGNRGDDTLDGGAGTDTAAYQDPRGDYLIAVGPGGAATITDLDGDEGTDTLIGIERILFDAEGTGDAFDLGIFNGIGTLDQAEIRVFVEMYIAYFNRAPDAEGLFYWGTRLADGMELTQIARSFFVQPETVALYPDPGAPGYNERLVDAVYANVLERAADPLGREYWIGQLESGAVEPGQFILDVIGGAKRFADPDASPELIAQAEADVRTITEKADIGLYYAAILGLGDPFGAARTVMEAYDVEDREGSLETARALADDFADRNEELTLQLVGVVDDPFAAA